MIKNYGLVRIVGGGLAGTEAAWQCLRAGHKVELYEMRPKKGTAAHHTGNLAELVCSNSLKSMSPKSAPGQLKHEMRALDSLVIGAAEGTSVPAGQALAVDRDKFSALIEQRLNEFDGFRRVDEEVATIDSFETLASKGEVLIIATGPLTSDPMVNALKTTVDGLDRLYFYDAIAPIIDASSLDMGPLFFGARYEESSDYLNIPLNKEQYEAFIDAVMAAEKMPLHEFEEPRYFEACLPIEVMIERGRDTLRFGPMKPVGLTDPATGRRPWGNIQLRRENTQGSMYSMVGFQTKMKWPDQKRVFSMLPGLGGVEFFRYGSVHRNTYLMSPQILGPDLSLRSNSHVFLAGQITGVEGYTESAAIGLLAGRAACARLGGESFRAPPPTTVIGALMNYVTVGPNGPFQPMNANFGLLPTGDGKTKEQRRLNQCLRATKDLDCYASAP
jgi:methylenetetrahydrofolate--tRNA-(uracil-5-)-methyltransferase